VKIHKISKTEKPMATGMAECEPSPAGPSKKKYREVETFAPSDESGSSKVGDEKKVGEASRWKGEPSGGEKEIEEAGSWKGKPSGGEKEIEEATSWKGEASGGEKEIDKVTRFNREPSGGGSRKSMKENEQVTSFRNVNCKCGMGPEMVICPACNSEVHGKDEGDLSNNLGRHLSEAHQMKTMVGPKM
jgi:hypothetical protein